MDIDLKLVIKRDVENNEREIIFVMDTESDDSLACQSSPLTESEMKMAVAFLRDCADAVESQLENKHFISH